MKARELDWRLEGLNVAHLLLAHSPQTAREVRPEVIGDAIRATATAWMLVYRKAPSLQQINFVGASHNGIDELLGNALREPTGLRESKAKKWLRSWYKERWKGSTHRFGHDFIDPDCRSCVDSLGDRDHLPLEQLEHGSPERQEALRRVGWQIDPANTSDQPKQRTDIEADGQFAEEARDRAPEGCGERRRQSTRHPDDDPELGAEEPGRLAPPHRPRTPAPSAPPQETSGGYPDCRISTGPNPEKGSRLEQAGRPNRTPEPAQKRGPEKKSRIREIWAHLSPSCTKQTAVNEYTLGL